MFFLFGWGHQTRKNFGHVISLKCNHCNNEDYWHLLRTTTWFTLFFIPAIPYSVEKYLLCPVCQYGISLDDQQFEKFRSIAEVNNDLKDGMISETEHTEKMHLLLDEKSAQQGMEETPLAITDKSSSDHCSHCGNKISSESNFCKFCGNKLV